MINKNFKPNQTIITGILKTSFFDGTTARITIDINDKTKRELIPWVKDAYSNCNKKFLPEILTTKESTIIGLHTQYSMKLYDADGVLQGNIDPQTLGKLPAGIAVDVFTTYNPEKCNGMYPQSISIDMEDGKIPQKESFNPFA